MSDLQLLSALAGWLTGGPPGAPESLPWGATLALAQQHGVLALLHRTARESCWARLPEDAQQALLRASRLALANAMVSERHLAGTLVLLARHGIHPLLLKGAALAQTHYADSVLRPRCDADLLIPAAARERVHDALTAAGCQRLNAVSGQHVSHQRVYVQDDPPGFSHAYDIHWRVSNRNLFAGVQCYEELFGRSVPVPALGPHARTLAPADALVLACVHRLAHHADELRLIWLYDIHLLVQGMDEWELAEFTERARARGVVRVCQDGVGEARRWLGTEHPGLQAWLTAPPGEPKSTARVLLSQGRLGLLLAELGSLPNLRARAQLLREHVLPPADYMLRRYDTHQRWLAVAGSVRLPDAAGIVQAPPAGAAVPLSRIARRGAAMHYRTSSSALLPAIWATMCGTPRQCLGAQRASPLCLSSRRIAVPRARACHDSRPRPHSDRNCERAAS